MKMGGKTGLFRFIKRMNGFTKDFIPQSNKILKGNIECFTGPMDILKYQILVFQINGIG
jgi:hypothetical protein